MIFIKKIPGLKETPVTIHIDRYDEATAYSLLGNVIAKAREVIGVVAILFREEWTKDPSTLVRAVFGHWIVNAMRHFSATTILCEKNDLSVIAAVHYRQIFELFLQVRHYASLDPEEKEKYADKIYTLGCIDYLEKIDVVKGHVHVEKGYKDVTEMLARCDKALVDEIRTERRKAIFNWFGCSYSKLAKKVNREGENLQSVYQIISADVHGTWNLALDICNPEPGVLDFRGYPDKTTMYIRASQLLCDVTSLYMNLWNEIAESVGAQKIYFIDDSD